MTITSSSLAWIIACFNLAFHTWLLLVGLGLLFCIVCTPFVWLLHGNSQQIKERTYARWDTIDKTKQHIKGTVKTVETINNAVDEAVKQGRVKIIK